MCVHVWERRGDRPTQWHTNQMILSSLWRKERLRGLSECPFWVEATQQKRAWCSGCLEQFSLCPPLLSTPSVVEKPGNRGKVLLFEWQDLHDVEPQFSPLLGWVWGGIGGLGETDCEEEGGPRLSSQDIMILGRMLYNFIGETLAKKSAQGIQPSRKSFVTVLHLACISWAPTMCQLLF